MWLTLSSAAAAGGRLRRMVRPGIEIHQFDDGRDLKKQRHRVGPVLVKINEFPYYSFEAASTNSAS